MAQPIQETQEKLAVDQLLWAQTIQEKDFPAFLQAYRLPPDTTTLMLLDAQPRRIVPLEERQNLLHFAFFNADFDFSSYTAGHIFHDLGELRWERQQDELQLVYTGHKEYRPERLATSEAALDKVYASEKAYFLFGKRLDKGQLKRIGSAAQEGDFAEVRIPRLLRYPRVPALQEAQRIQLVMCEYVDPQTAQNVAYRYKSLKAFKKKSDTRSEMIDESL